MSQPAPSVANLLSTLPKPRLVDLGRQFGVAIAKPNGVPITESVDRLVESGQLVFRELLEWMRRDELRRACKTFGLNDKERSRAALAGSLLKAHGAQSVPPASIFGEIGPQRSIPEPAVAETEAAWLDAARGKTLRELEALVASKAPGDEPDAPPAELPRPRVLRFEVAADTFATFREAMQRLRRQAGGSLDDDAVLLAMARHVLGGPREEGRSSYQISLTVCGACGSGAQTAAGELVPVDAAVVDMAECDGQHLGELLPSATALRAANENASLDAASTAGADGRTHDAPAEPNGDESSATCQSSDHAHVDAESWRESDAAVAPDVTPPQRAAGADVRPSRARQSVPPALRRAVLARDRHRCTVPGCTHATFVDVHHVQPRAEGGRNEASNLLVLCSLCRARHKEQYAAQGFMPRTEFRAGF